MVIKVSFLGLFRPSIISFMINLIVREYKTLYPYYIHIIFILRVGYACIKYRRIALGIAMNRLSTYNLKNLYLHRLEINVKCTKTFITNIVEERSCSYNSLCLSVGPSVLSFVSPSLTLFKFLLNIKAIL